MECTPFSPAAGTFSDGDEVDGVDGTSALVPAADSHTVKELNK